MQKSAVFIVWKAYQRRVDALKEYFKTDPVYIHFAWEEGSRLRKALSYPLKFSRTLQILLARRPGLVFVQAPPTFAVYVTWLYGKLTGTDYVVDAHNTMIYDSFWYKLPLAKYVLKKAKTVIVHNAYVAEKAQELRIPHTVLMCRPPDIDPRQYTLPEIYRRRPARPRVVVPCSFDVDEPLDELQKATRMLPDVDFFVTWFRERLPANFVRGFGENTVFTGFLPVDEFNAVLAHADVFLVLTTRIGTQPQAAVEALAFEKAMVISDLEVIRELFPRGSVYVQNCAEAIAAGIRTALQRQSELVAEMASFKQEKIREWERQFRALTTRVNGC
jgi:glycosyltransferase involved in cell wall biosynthesis